MTGPSSSDPFPPLSVIEQQSEDAASELAQDLGVSTDRASHRTVLNSLKKFLDHPGNIDIYLLPWLQDIIQEFEIAVPRGSKKAQLSACIQMAGEDIQRRIVSRQQEVVRRWAEDYQVEWHSSGSAVRGRRDSHRARLVSVERGGVERPRASRGSRYSPSPLTRERLPPPEGVGSQDEEDGGGWGQITDATPPATPTTTQNVAPYTPPIRSLAQAQTSASPRIPPQPVVIVDDTHPSLAQTQIPASPRVLPQPVVIVDNTHPSLAQTQTPASPRILPQPVVIVDSTTHSLAQAQTSAAPVSALPPTGIVDNTETRFMLPNRQDRTFLEDVRPAFEPTVSTSTTDPKGKGKRKLSVRSTADISHGSSAARSASDQSNASSPRSSPSGTAFNTHSEQTHTLPVNIVPVLSPSENTKFSCDDGRFVASVTLHGEVLFKKAFRRAVAKFTEIWEDELFPVIMEELALETRRDQKARQQAYDDKEDEVA